MLHPICYTPTDFMVHRYSPIFTDPQMQSWRHEQTLKTCRHTNAICSVRFLVSWPSHSYETKPLCVWVCVYVCVSCRMMPQLEINITLGSIGQKLDCKSYQTQLCLNVAHDLKHLGTTSQHQRMNGVASDSRVLALQFLKSHRASGMTWNHDVSTFS